MAAVRVVYLWMEREGNLVSVSVATRISPTFSRKCRFHCDFLKYSLRRGIRIPARNCYAYDFDSGIQLVIPTVWLPCRFESSIGVFMGEGCDHKSSINSLPNYFRFSANPSTSSNLLYRTAALNVLLLIRLWWLTASEMLELAIVTYQG